MTELLTESFCERCGTRYTFQTAAPKGGRVRSLKVLSKGLRNFVASDDISFSDAFADARSDEEREASSHQLEAFHQTFNFCLDCRQYTCGNCWNDGDNRCLTCAPDLSQEILPVAFPTPVGQEAEPVQTRPAPLEPTSWPSADLERESPAPSGPAAILAAAAASGVAGQEAEPEIEPDVPSIAGPIGAESDAAAAVQAAEPVVTEPEVAAALLAEGPEAPEPKAPEPEPVVVPAEQIPEPEPVAPAAPAAPPAGADGPDERAAAAVVGTAAFLRRFRPGESLDAALAEFEAGEAARAPEPTPPQAAPQPVAPPEPVTPPAAAAAAITTPPVGTPQEPAAPPQDVVGTPTWRITAPDTEAPAIAAAAAAAAPSPGRQPTAAPDATPAWPPLPPGTEPSWPVAPQWPPQPSSPVSLGRDALWAASNREVAASPAPSAVRPCVSCGLSLSSTARFCRRCGSPQG